MQYVGGVANLLLRKAIQIKSLVRVRRPVGVGHGHRDARSSSVGATMGVEVFDLFENDQHVHHRPQ